MPIMSVTRLGSVDGLKYTFRCDYITQMIKLTLTTDDRDNEIFNFINNVGIMEIVCNWACHILLAMY